MDIDGYHRWERVQIEATYFPYKTCFIIGSHTVDFLKPDTFPYMMCVCVCVCVCVEKKKTENRKYEGADEESTYPSHIYNARECKIARRALDG